MKIESKRIFISDLPDDVCEKDIQQKFGGFGQVTSIEIKHRKDIGPKNKTQQFAFINISIDDRQLKNCFDEFSNKKWKGSYVEIQLAKESFLDRLKREREQAQVNGTAPKQETITEQPKPPIKNGETKIVKKYKSSSSESSSEDSSEEETVPETPTVKRVVNIEIIRPEDVYEDIVVKNNKFKKFNGKIEGFGKEPVAVVEDKKKKKSLDPSRQAADKKRINSMLEMKRSYNKQKLVIKSALSKIDVDANNATKFTETEAKGVKRKAATSDKKALFDEEDGNDEEVNFDLKEQFQGRKGQQLFELQSKYKNDKRFQMDSRFAEKDDPETDRIEDEDEISREEESRKQLEILGEVLGKKITPRQTNENKRGMLRFDPSQPDHTKYEIKEQEEKKRKKNKEVEEKAVVLPEVSSEKFYQVTDALKQSLQEKQSFSLLNMFGRSNEVEDDKEEEKMEEETVGESAKVVKKVKGGKEKNPFRYDSTDDEGEEASPKIEETKEESKEESQKIRLGPARIWTEPFFFKKDDYRFQEGVAFMKKLQSSRNDLLVQRKEVREIVKYRMNKNMKNEAKKKFNKKGPRKMANRMKRK